MSVLCVGQLVADVVVRPVDGIPRSGTANAVEDLQLVAGGCAANAACVLAKLGVKTALAAAAGRDALGDVSEGGRHWRLRCLYLLLPYPLVYRLRGGVARMVVPAADHLGYLAHGFRPLGAYIDDEGP